LTIHVMCLCSVDSSEGVHSDQEELLQHAAPAPPPGSNTSSKGGVRSMGSSIMSAEVDSALDEAVWEAKYRTVNQKYHSTNEQKVTMDTTVPTNRRYSTAQSTRNTTVPTNRR
jgi:hypothetical protein